MLPPAVAVSRTDATLPGARLIPQLHTQPPLDFSRRGCILEIDPEISLAPVGG